ncbi:SRPBCC family protein [Demequina sp. NBRC 110056]|uniref:SRPBCC family protein n=1 Tax=Demequina sp. NBRC 110056 TaxID=1570345 RepID=UPI0009FF3D1C|nr:SRPBCC family protein [Demequina sp. NBRC 110056]
MPVYRFRTEHLTVVPATLDEVWRYIDDRAAQVEFDPRIQRIDVIEGVWGEPGCRMVATARTPDGGLHTFEQVIEAFDRPRSYTTSVAFPEGVTRSTQSFSSGAAGVEWTHVTEVVTRRVSWVEHLALKASERSRRAEALADYARDREALLAALEAHRSR